MRKRCISVIVVCLLFICGSITVLAASNSTTYDFKNAEVKVSQSVSFVYGPLTLQDKYWGNASIYGKDSDAASVKVVGGVSDNKLIDTTLSVTKKSVSVSEKKCGYGHQYGYICTTFEGTDHEIKASDPN